MKVPKLHKHKSGKGRVRIRGRDFYTKAKWGDGSEPSEACCDCYVDILRQEVHGYVDASKLAVATLMRAFMEDAERVYPRSGVKGGEAVNFQYVMKRMAPFKGMPIERFGLAELNAIAASMIADDCSRSYINRTVRRVVWVFRWGANQGLVDSDPNKPSTLVRLGSWIPLRAGRMPQVCLRPSPRGPCRLPRVRRGEGLSAVRIGPYWQHDRALPRVHLGEPGFQGAALAVFEEVGRLIDRTIGE